jgi:DNA-binding HxlR family transcriptional regulator
MRQSSSRLKHRSTSLRLPSIRRAATDVGAVSSASVATHAPSCEEHDNAGYCPYSQHAVELIGRRWTGSILMVIGERSLRFGEIRSAIPGLSDRLLDARLTELETEGIVRRSECEGEVRYLTTPKGLELQPVFASISAWASAHAVDEPHEQPGRRRC